MLKLKRLKRVLPVFLLITVGVLVYLLVNKTQLVSASDTVDNTSVTENISQTNTGSQVVFVSDQVGYSFHLSATNTVVYNKTTNGGTTWGSGVTVDSQTDTEKVAVWYDRWTPGDTTGNFIYIITTDSGASDIWYRTLDTSGDSLSGAGMVSVTSSPGPNKSNSFVAGGEVATITKGTDGVLYVGIIDATSSYIIKCSATCTTASNWADAGTSPLDASDQNWSALIPLASGNIMVIEHNDSVDDTLSKVWNGSAWDASWATIDSNCIVNLNSSMGSMGVTVDRTGSSVYIVEACDNVTLGTDDDIRSYSYSGGAWTAKTDVLTNQTRGITNSKIARDENTGDLYVLYLTTASGTPTDLTTQSIFWKKSTNGMTSWGSESSALAGPDTLSSGTLNFTSSERIYGTWGQDNGGSADSYNGATLADLSAGSPGFPVTSVIDNFNRSNGSINGSAPSSGVGTWSSAEICGGVKTLTISSNQITGSNAAVYNSNYLSTSYGPDVETYATVNAVGNTGNNEIIAFYARLASAGSAGADGYELEIQPDGDWIFWKMTNCGFVQQGSNLTQPVGAGDLVGFSVTGTSTTTLKAWYKPSGGAWSLRSSATDSSSPFTSAGQIGAEMYSTAPLFDDLGGGTIGGGSAPAAPTKVFPDSGVTSVASLPIFQLATTDADNDYLQYFIQIYDATACGGSQVGSDIDQSSLQTNWQGQDANGGLAYIGNSVITSSTIARYQYAGTALTSGHLYSWRAKAKDPAGTNTYGSLTSCTDFTVGSSEVQIRGGTNINGGTTIN